ncbi:hypothetical protein LCGC14_1384830, partial [marine sediment metagenome]
IPDTQTLCQGKFLVTLPNIVFQIEEIALTNELFESTVNWHCLPNARKGTEDPLLTSIET